MFLIMKICSNFLGNIDIETTFDNELSSGSFCFWSNWFNTDNTNIFHDGLSCDLLG